MMKATHNNRISELFDPAPLCRTAAQREASRLNGRLSKGPTTEAGKFRSSQNAKKHGFLSARFAPPADARDDDECYRRICRHLTAEFNPGSFFAGAMLACLAHDMIQLARCRAMIEAAQRPAAVPAEDLEKYQQLRAARRDLKPAQRLLGRLDAGLPPDLTPRAATRVAARVADAVEGLREYVEQEDGLKEAEMDEMELAEFVEYRDRWLAVKPGHKKLLHTKHVASIASGSAQAGTIDSKRLRVALIQVIADLQRIIVARKNVESRLKQRQDNDLVFLADNPQRLLLLRRYATRIERSIERKVQELRRK